MTDDITTHLAHATAGGYDAAVEVIALAEHHADIFMVLMHLAESPADHEAQEFSRASVSVSMSPEALAEVFSAMDNLEQGRFLSEVARLLPLFQAIVISEAEFSSSTVEFWKACIPEKKP
jgi:hypothetical protein